MTRAPLGMKTTNVKARAFQTPAPTMPIGTIKQRSAKRGSTRKVKKAAPLLEQVTQERTVTAEEEPEREIEYMPPKPKRESIWPGMAYSMLIKLYSPP